MKDWKTDQIRKANKEHRQFIEEASQEQFVASARAKRYPEGSTWFWALQAVYGPRENGNDRST